jgi:hypothetical protein
MAKNMYVATVLIGGGVGALDAIDGDLLADLDAAFVQTDGIVYFYHLDATSGAAESSPDVIAPDSNAGDKRWIKQAVSGGGAADYFRLHDSKAATTDGGTFTSGAWQKRTLTEDINDISGASVASSVITLPAGTYRCFARCPAYRVDMHVGRLRNTSDNTTAIIGGGSRVGEAWSASQSDTIIQGRFTIAAEKTFEVQHRCLTTKADNGFGVFNNFGENEIYTVAEFWKVG